MVEMATRNIGPEHILKDFDYLIKDEIDLDEDSVEKEDLDYEEFDQLEPEEAVEPETLGTVPENDGSQHVLLAMFTQEGEEIPLTNIPLPDRLTFASTESPPCNLLLIDSAENLPVIIQPASPPRAPVSPVYAENTPSVNQSWPRDVVVQLNDSALTDLHIRADPALGVDDVTTEENTFHLADEHQIFQQVTERPQRARRGRPMQKRGQERGRPRTRGGGETGLRQAAGERKWVEGDRLIEVHVDDDDVPDELRKMVMQVVDAREAARLRPTERARTRRVRKAEPYDDEWIDADDGDDEALFARGDISARFKWSSMRDYQSNREKFLPRQTGPVVTSENAYGAFSQYWDDGILSHIVKETNRYAAGISRSSAAFAHDWYDTNIHEILVLFSFWIMLGVIRMPSTKSCFSMNPLLQTNIYRMMFSHNRYKNLCRALHFNNIRNRPTNDSNFLFGLSPILDYLNYRFKEAYIPSQNICIDESLSLSKGSLCFQQYIKTKTARFRVKTFELCESSTGYLWSFFVDAGPGTKYDPAFPTTLLKSTSAVLKLIHPLLDQGYTLFMNNVSPILAKFLKTRKTDCVGPLRPNCRNVPPLISLCNLKEGQFVARHSGDVAVLAFQNKKIKITTVSTYHGNSQDRMDAKPHRPPHYKPQVILDYSRAMGGVDRKDQLLEPYLLEKQRKHAKWNMTVFKRLLNCSIINSRILLQSSTGTPKDDLVFRLELVDQILQQHLQQVPERAAEL